MVSLGGGGGGGKGTSSLHCILIRLLPFWIMKSPQYVYSNFDWPVGCKLKGGGMLFCEH